jgi:hypothetical protein
MNRSNIVITLIAATVLLMAGSAQTGSQAQTPSTDPGFTAGMFNGRMWAGTPQESKAFYLLGVREALLATGSNELNKYSSEKFTRAEIARSMDVFYQTPENARIPLTSALEICMMKFNGATLQELEIETLGSRRAALKDYK